MKVVFHTLGCKVNQYDTQQIMQDLMNRGYEVVQEGEYFDICVINTCAVTNESSRKSRQLVRKFKSINPSGIVVVTGCYSETNQEEVKSITQADIITGTKNRTIIAEMIEKFIGNRQRISDFSQLDDIDVFPIDCIDKTRATIKIEDGCNMFCTYCIIPYARGRIQSHNPDIVIEDIKKLVDKGYQEIILTGIHIASYNYLDVRLIDLLELINSKTEIKRVRLGSLEPQLITEDFLSRLSNVDNFCPHFHLSMQSGCDKILDLMNRRYTTKLYFDNCVKIREYFDDAMITTDVIVGFPSETEEDFNVTLEFCETINFSHIHVFPYSPKVGTPAAKMKNQISNAEKHSRALRLIEKSTKMEQGIFKEQLGKSVNVLFEQRKDNVYHGYTENYLPVKLQSTTDVTNKVMNVKIVNYDETSLIAVD